MGRPKKVRAPSIEELATEETEHDEIPSNLMDEEDREDMELALGDFTPLFPDADKPMSKTPAHIVVHMLHPINGFEYKGKLPPDASEDAIYQQWGNGTFNIKLVDERGRYLRSRTGIKISMNVEREADKMQSLAPASNGIDATALRDMLREERERSIAMVKAEREALAARSGEDRHRADAFLALVTESRKAEAEQTRAWFQAQHQASTESFKQILMIMSTSHAQQMQLMQANAGKPNESLQLFLAGLQFAQGIDMDEQEKPDPMMGLLAGGLQMFGQVAGAAKTKAISATPKRKALANGAPAPLTTPPPVMPPELAPMVPAMPAMPELAPPKKKGAFSEEEVEEIKALKILSAQKGVSMAALLKLGRENIDQLSTFLPGGSAVAEEPEEGEEDEEEEELDADGNPVQDSDDGGTDDGDDGEDESESEDSMDDEGPSDEEGPV